ncbi:MAG: FAD:protein FMN transferase, partial [Gammaproteobacteria bacterium]|nr:FAD:protein FMN transferase [Gammaproteobacteria bacterium]
ERQQKAVSRISEDFQRMHHEWHAWKPGPLVQINRALAQGQSVRVLPSLIPIIKQSSVLSQQSEGLFDPAIGGLLSLWGFQSDGRPNGPPPDAEAIARWVQAEPHMADLTLDGDMLSSTNPAVQLDFGAFAKGYAVDLAIARLREAGIDNAIINAGGDLRSIGSKNGKPWRVGVRHPQGEGVLATIEVSGDESVFTSGNYERYREHEGVRYNHILDPRTGMPVNGVTSVTVLHDNGAVADAAATALVVAGPEAWHRIARQMGIKFVMLVDDAGVVYMNPAMQHRVEFQAEPPGDIRLSDPL